MGADVARARVALLVAAALGCTGRRRPEARADVAVAADPFAAGPFAREAAGEPGGWWVWRGIADDDRVVEEITEADMNPRTGPGGWPGCPRGVVCTRAGIHLVALGPRGEFWRVLNVPTSSDFQDVGRYALGDGVIEVERARHYSCAHPGVRDATRLRAQLRYRMRGDALWLATDAQGNLSLAPVAPAAPRRWVVFRRVSERDFLRVHLVRMCQDEGREPRCDRGCYSESWGR